MPTHNHAQAQEFPCAGPVNATVRVGSGVLNVTAEDSNVAVVEVSPYDDSEASRAAADNTKVQFNGDRLNIEVAETAGGWIFRRSGRVRIDLRLPIDSQLRAQTGSADVHADGRLGATTIHTGSGDSYVTETSGDLTVQSGSGDVRAERVGGILRARAASGDVSAASVAGEVIVELASGDVDIEEVGGPVRASTASGDINIASANGTNVRIRSASGDVTVGVPVGTRVWLDLSTMSGSTSTDLAMSPAAPELGAQLSLEVRTMSGDISVHRVAA